MKGVHKKGQQTLFGQSPKGLLMDFLADYPQIEFMKGPVKELDRKQIRDIMLEMKNEDMKHKGYSMYEKEDQHVTAEMLNTGKITARKVEAASFLKEHRRTSLAEVNGFIQWPYILYLDKIKIGLINFSNSMMRNSERDALLPKGKTVNDFNGRNIQTCVAYPWASHFLVGKLCATVACAIGRQDGLDFVETTSLFGKSIQYDRLPFLRQHGFTTGSTGATYLFPHVFFQQLQKHLQTFYGGYLVNDEYFSKKKALLLALTRVTGLEDKGYKITNVSMKRGYYLSIINEKINKFEEKRLPPADIDEAVEYWRRRWLVKRL